MKRVLLTGGSGFIGRNIKDELAKKCELYIPTRSELNLLDENKVYEYIEKNNIEVVIHSANPNPVKNPLDKANRMFEDSIRVFLNLQQAEKLYEKLIFLGSGAEYDKSKDMDMIHEEEFGRSIPYDTYGLIKYNIHKLLEQSPKMYNLRLFAVYGPTDHESKFITHVIRSILENKDITIRQDCRFDYMHVSDLVDILDYFIYNKPKYQTYNVCSGKVLYLSEIAEIIKREMNSTNSIIILNEGYNKAYTANNERLIKEIKNLEFTDIIDGICQQIEYERKTYEKKSS
ncbi:MAG: NAD(P)-dependent oxidoreductase [Eubacterium sp.]|nr:NAD(P)-dependent oxidoreductase [Eubacterium sp.]